MSRHWTARKTSTLDDSAIESEPFEKAYPLFRTELDAAAARRQSLRLFAGYAIMWLPMHCLIVWIWGRSPGLASTIVIVTITAVLTIAFAKWLGLTELLQHLPLVAMLGIVLILVGYLGSQPGFLRM